MMNDPTDRLTVWIRSSTPALLPSMKPDTEPLTACATSLPSQRSNE